MTIGYIKNLIFSGFILIPLITATVLLFYSKSGSNEIPIVIPEAARIYNEKGLNYYNEAKYGLEAKRKIKEAAIKYEEAAAELRKAIEIIPNYVEAHRNLAKVYYSQKKFPESVREYERLVELIPNDIDARKDLALAYEKVGRYSDVIQQLEIAISITPDPIVKEIIRTTIEEVKKEINQ